MLILIARHSEGVIKRFKDFGIEKIYTSILKKQAFVKNYSKVHNLTKKEIVIMEDDLLDLAVLREVEVFFTTPNAIKILKDKAHYIKKRTFDDGTVREICDLIISSKGSSANSEFKCFIKRRG